VVGLLLLGADMRIDGAGCTGELSARGGDLGAQVGDLDDEASNACDETVEGLRQLADLVAGQLGQAGIERRFGGRDPLQVGGDRSDRSRQRVD
jgi:hypothetical protein